MEWREHHYGGVPIESSNAETGLPNRKPNRVQPDGCYPNVLLHESGGQTA